MDDTNHKKKIILVGMPDMALVCLNKLVTEGFNIVAVVPPQRSNPTAQILKRTAEMHNLAFFEFEKTPNEPEFIERLKALQADIGIVCSYERLLSKEFLETTKDGYINCHPSLLPEYRGANPYHHVILNGEEKTGITLHFMDENFDTGDIISQKEILMDGKETMGSLFNSCNFLFAQELVGILKEYENSGQIPRTKQPEQPEGTTFRAAPKVNGDIFINFDSPARQIERLIRASNPFYSCNTFFRGTGMRIIAADYVEEEHSKEPSHIERHDNKLSIVTKDGYLYPKIVQIGSWGIFDTREFIQKFNPQIGEKLGL